MRNTIQIATKEKKVTIINLSYLSYKHNTYYIFGPPEWVLIQGLAWLGLHALNFHHWEHLQNTKKTWSKGKFISSTMDPEILS